MLSDVTAIYLGRSPSGRYVLTDKGFVPYEEYEGEDYTQTTEYSQEPDYKQVVPDNEEGEDILK